MLNVNIELDIEHSILLCMTSANGWILSWLETELTVMLNKQHIKKLPATIMLCQKHGGQPPLSIEKQLAQDLDF